MNTTPHTAWTVALVDSRGTELFLATYLSLYDARIAAHRLTQLYPDTAAYLQADDTAQWLEVQS